MGSARIALSISSILLGHRSRTRQNFSLSFLSSAPQPAPTHPDRPNWKKIVDGVEAAAKGMRSGEEEGSRRRRSNAEHRQRGAAGQARARAGAGCALEDAKVGSHFGLDNEESGQERMEERRRQLEPNRCDSREERQRQEDTPREHRASPDPTLADVLERTVFRRHREKARRPWRAPSKKEFTSFVPTGVA